MESPYSMTANTASKLNRLRAQGPPDLILTSARPRATSCVFRFSVARHRPIRTATWALTASLGRYTLISARTPRATSPKSHTPSTPLCVVSHRLSLQSVLFFTSNVTVRFSRETTNLASVPVAASTPFKVVGAPNVMLETVKRGEDDMFEMDGKRTIILRIFEQYGGHAKATLKM